MRKRTVETPAIVPAPCGHPVITFDGETAPACLWGRPGYPPAFAAIDTEVFTQMEAASQEHIGWQGLRRVARPELLDPFGQPWLLDPFGQRRPPEE